MFGKCKVRGDLRGWGGWRWKTGAPALLCCLLLATDNVWADEGMIRLIGSGWVADVPTWVAAGHGWFDEDAVGQAGPRVEVIEAGSGQQALSRLIAGEGEFALAATTPVARAMLAGDDADDPLLILASTALSNRSHYLLARGDSTILNPADLKGQRVGVMMGTSGHFGWSRFARFHGLSDEDLTLVDVPISEMASALASGELDAGVFWDPWGEEAQQRLEERGRQFSMRTLYSVNWLLVTRRSVIEAHPGAAEQIMRGYLRAMTALQQSRAEQMHWHVRADHLAVEDLVKQSSGIIWYLTLDWSVLTNMQAQFDWLAGWPELAEARIPSPENYLYAAPLNRVAPSSVSLPGYLVCIEATVMGCWP